MSTTPTILNYDLAATPPGTIRRYWLRVASNALGNPMRIPLLVARGVEDGPTLGITAALHGDELNGIPVIQRLFGELEPGKMRGTIVGVPIVNLPGFHRQTRVFSDGKDLNHLMPGHPEGNASQIYAHRVVDRLVRHFDYLLDLHTASRGRINSYYVRADMADEKTRRMAILQNPQLIVHNPPNDGTLRGAADDLGIPAITLEVGNPGVYQKGLIRSGLVGVHNVMSWLGITDDKIVEPKEPSIRCKRSFWIFTKAGGLLNVHVGLLERITEGQHIATLRNVWGDVIEEYHAPTAGVVIGKATAPVNQSGGRILHLGVEG